MSLRAIVGDVETTGADRSKDRVVELAWIEIDENLQVLDRQYSLIDPQMPISATASGIHGITAADVAEAPTIEQFFSLVLSPDHFAHSEVVLIAHNAPFDRGFLQRYIPIGIELCTLRLARRVFPEAENHKLQTLMYQLGLSRGKSHSAEGDVDTCLDLLRKICERTGKSLQELLNEAMEPIWVEVQPFGKHKGTKLRDLPAGYIAWLLKLDNLDADLRWSLGKVNDERFDALRMRA
jgi:exodeoxyribonuclease X